MKRDKRTQNILFTITLTRSSIREPMADTTQYVTCCVDCVCCGSSGNWDFCGTERFVTDGECVECRAVVAGDDGRDKTE